MLFNSIEYLLFLPLVFGLYWLLNNKVLLQNIFLLAASYFFYGFWDYRFLSLIIISSLTDYLIGLKIHASKKKDTRTFFLLLSLLVNLGIFFYFKYCDFFIESFIQLTAYFDYYPSVNTLSIVLPVGISFYTFQTLSYTIDIYKQKIEPTKNIISFFTFVAYFPQLVAGPIERASNLLPQIRNKRQYSPALAKLGLKQILWGFFKKVVIADNCALFVDPIFANYTEYSGPVLILGAVLFAIQIYGDFSGYSDIAIGTSKLFGIRLMQNFATPYFSRDIAEFWRRWHISLSTWFRDYLYIPLGGSRVGTSKKVRNIFAIFLISGFWHGANWTLIFWGFLHACFYLPQMVNKSNRRFLKVVASDQRFPSLKEFRQIFITFCLVTIAWIFFRAPTLFDSVQYIKFLFYNPSSVDGMSLFAGNEQVLIVLISSILFMTVIEWTNRKYEFGIYKLNFNKWLRFFLYLIMVIAIIQYFFVSASNFIYFQF